MHALSLVQLSVLVSDLSVCSVGHYQYCFDVCHTLGLAVQKLVLLRTFLFISSYILV